MTLYKINKYTVMARGANISSVTLKEEEKFIRTSNENEITPESMVCIKSFLSLGGHEAKVFWQTR